MARAASLRGPTFNPDVFALGASVAVHLAILILVLGLGTKALKTEEQKSQIKQGEVKIPVQLMDPSTGAMMTLGQHAFTGRALDTPVTQQEVSTHNVKKMQSLASQLSRLHDLGMGNGAPTRSAGVKVSAATVDQALNSANQALKGAAARAGSGGLASQNLLVASSGEKTRVIDPKEEARVRKVFESLQAKLSAAYDRAQKSDPTLSLALSYQGVVDSSGHLGKLKFQAKGEYTPAGLQVLEQQVNAVLSGADLGKNLSGITIRGERLFVQ